MFCFMIGIYSLDKWTDFFAPTPKQETLDLTSQYLKVPKERCYFTETFDDVTKETELNCPYFKKYYNSQFNTVHVDSLPHGYDN